MNRRSFIKRSCAALGLALAWPLMPSLGAVGSCAGRHRGDNEITVDKLRRVKAVLDAQPPATWWLVGRGDSETRAVYRGTHTYMEFVSCDGDRQWPEVLRRDEVLRRLA